MKLSELWEAQAMGGREDPIRVGRWTRFHEILLYCLFDGDSYNEIFPLYPIHGTFPKKETKKQIPLCNGL